MGGCVSQTPKPEPNKNTPVPQAKPTETFAQIEARQKKLADAYAKSCENQKQLDERILSTADTLVRMPEYVERLMTGKLEEKKEVVQQKAAEIETNIQAKRDEVANNLEAKKDEAMNMKDDKVSQAIQKMDSVKQEVDQTKAGMQAAESDVKKDELAAAQAPEETKQSAINEEFKQPEEAKAEENKAAEPAAPAEPAPAAATTAQPVTDAKPAEEKKTESTVPVNQTVSKPAEQTAAAPATTTAPVVEESEYDKNLRVLRAGCAHKKQLQAFIKQLDEETKACDAFVKGLTEDQKKNPIQVADRFKKADKLLAAYNANSVDKFEKIYKNKDLKALVNDLCCCYFDKPVAAGLDALIAQSKDDSDKLLEERHAAYVEEQMANQPSGLEQFTSKNRDHFDDIKKSWAENTSPLKDSMANHEAELAKISAEWKEEASPVREQMEEIVDKLEDAVQSMMVKLKDIELPSNPRGDDEVQAEDSSDDEPVGNLEKKDAAGTDAQKSNVAQDSQKQAVVIDAEEASRQANAADPAAIA